MVKVKRVIPMTFEEYEMFARTTAIYPREYAITYPALGLCGEAGEVAEKIKKRVRDGNFDPDALHKEIGDVLWYLAALCRDISEEYGSEYSLSAAANKNVTKLKDRQNRGVLKGNGDER